jgi:hypothetical protein
MAKLVGKLAIGRQLVSSRLVRCEANRESAALECGAASNSNVFLFMLVPLVVVVALRSFMTEKREATALATKILFH